MDDHNVDGIGRIVTTQTSSLSCSSSLAQRGIADLEQLLANHDVLDSTSRNRVLQSVDLSLSERSCHVGQPIVMTVTWVVYYRARCGTFNVPVFKSSDFRIEDAPEIPDAQMAEKSTIHGIPVTVTENRLRIANREAAALSFRKLLIPQKPGRFVLDPIEVSAEMAVARIPTGDPNNPYDLQWQLHQVRSRSAELYVKAGP